MPPPAKAGDDDVSVEDALEALETLQRFLEKASGKKGGDELDFEEAGAATRDPTAKEKRVLDIIRGLAAKSKDGTVGRLEVIQACERAKIPPVQIGIVMNEMKKLGHLKEPKPGRYKVAKG